MDRDLFREELDELLPHIQDWLTTGENEMYQLHYEDKKGAGCCKVLKSQEEVEKAMKSLARRHVTGVLRLQSIGTIGTIGSVEPTSDGVWNWWYDKDIVK